ncbi:MAG: hypothetical protein ACN4GT_12430 [Gammaproteobacteria bacterium]
MSSRHRLEELLQKRQVWKAGQGDVHRRVLPTGFSELDPVLGGGWPAGRLIELHVDCHGIGELRLIMPALVELIGAGDQSGGRCKPSRGGRSSHQWIMLVAPPYVPYAPAFAWQGLDMSRLLVVRCRRQADVLWASEQALQSQTCAAVLAWCDGTEDRALRRLQLAAEANGSCLLVLFRPLRFARQRSPATLRIRLLPKRPGLLHLQIFKLRGGRPRSLTLDVGLAGAEPGARHG